MKKIETIDLKQFGIQTIGNFCDPLTGECYSDDAKEKIMETKIDPVCKMEVKVEGAQYVSDYAGEKYYFCSAGCTLLKKIQLSMWKIPCRTNLPVPKV